MTARHPQELNRPTPRPEAGPDGPAPDRFPALAAWQHRWRADPASHERRDLLWRLACLEAQARELGALGLHETAELVLRQARRLAADSSAAPRATAP